MLCLKQVLRENLDLKYSGGGGLVVTVIVVSPINVPFKKVDKTTF